MHITTKVVSSFPVHGEMCSIKHYVIQFVSILWLVGGFLRFPPPLKLTEILLKVALNTLHQPKEMSQGQQSNQKIVEIWANHIPLAQIYTTAHILGVADVLQY
jgi:hypothetical protein